MSESFPNLCPLTGALVAPDELSKEPFPSAPIGIVIHYTADRGLEKIRKSLVSSGLCYHLIIGREGNLEQHAWMDRTVWHAGKAVWRGYSPNHRFLAVALESWGSLRQEAGVFKSWAGKEIDHKDVAERKNNLNGKTEFWDAATPEQMAILNRVCFWAIENGIDPQNICGHDECAIPAGRKDDPGGVLPMSMDDYRRFVEVDYKKSKGLA